MDDLSANCRKPSGVCINAIDYIPMKSLTVKRPLRLTRFAALAFLIVASAGSTSLLADDPLDNLRPIQDVTDRRAGGGNCVAPARGQLSAYVPSPARGFVRLGSAYNVHRLVNTPETESKPEVGDWEGSGACDCRWLASDRYQPCGTFKSLRSRDRSVAWQVGTKINVTIGAGLLPGLLTKLGVNSELAFARTATVLISTGSEDEVPRMQCFSRFIRIIDYDDTVTATVAVVCRVETFYNPETNKSMEVWVGGVDQEDMTVTGYARGRFSQITMPDCPNTTFPVPEEYDGKRSTKCAPRIIGCPDVNPNPPPDCGIYLPS